MLWTSQGPWHNRAIIPNGPTWTWTSPLIVTSLRGPKSSGLSEPEWVSSPGRDHKTSGALLQLISAPCYPLTCPWLAPILPLSQSNPSLPTEHPWQHFELILQNSITFSHAFAGIFQNSSSQFQHHIMEECFLLKSPKIPYLVMLRIFSNSGSQTMAHDPAVGHNLNFGKSQKICRPALTVVQQDIPECYLGDKVGHGLNGRHYNILK